MEVSHKKIRTDVSQSITPKNRIGLTDQQTDALMGEEYVIEKVDVCCLFGVDFYVPQIFVLYC